MTASDKLVVWLFQSRPERILPLLPNLPEDAGRSRAGWRNAWSVGGEERLPAIATQIRSRVAGSALKSRHHS